MKRYQGYREFPERGARSVLTLGNFDGVHLGHQAILKTVAQNAREAALESVAYTFHPHPRAVLRPELPHELLSTVDDRRERIAALGVQSLIEEPFTREFALMEAEHFFNQILLNRLRAQQIVVGHDFAFGRGRAGHLGELRAFCEKAGVALQVTSPLAMDGQVISSSLIRAALGHGEVEEVARWLGRPFSYRGVVQRGAQRGRGIGFPTANLEPGSQCRVAYGVYVAGVRVIEPGVPGDGAAVSGDRQGKGSASRIWPGVCNFGVRPTVQAQGAPLLEVHLLESPPQRQWDLYGREIEVQLLHRIRGEQRFASFDALREQIAGDVSVAREWWGVIK